MRAKRVKVLIRKEIESSEENDEKENVFHQEAEGTGTDKKSKTSSSSESNKVEDDKIVELSEYWPDGTDLDDSHIPSDNTLLYLYSIEACQKCDACFTVNQITEVVRMFEYYSGDTRKYVECKDHPKEFKKFIAESGKDQKSASDVGVNIVSLLLEQCKYGKKTG